MIGWAGFFAISVAEVPAGGLILDLIQSLQQLEEDPSSKQDELGTLMVEEVIVYEITIRREMIWQLLI